MSALHAIFHNLSQCVVKYTSWVFAYKPLSLLYGRLIRCFKRHETNPVAFFDWIDLQISLCTILRGFLGVYVVIPSLHSDLPCVVVG
jgi:hypothetical protein